MSGGQNTSGGINTCELYDPATGTWTPTGSMANARNNHTATLLANGKVLVVGGSFFNPEIYDPATGTWSSGGILNRVRVEHTATLLPDGKVLVTGGQATGGGTAELYNPATNTWTLTGGSSILQRLCKARPAAQR